MNRNQDVLLIVWTIYPINGYLSLDQVEDTQAPKITRSLSLTFPTCVSELPYFLSIWPWGARTSSLMQIHKLVAAMVLLCKDKLKYIVQLNRTQHNKCYTKLWEAQLVRIPCLVGNLSRLLVNKYLKLLDN